MNPDPNLIEDLRLLEPMNPLWFWLAGAAVLLVVLVVLYLRFRKPRVVRPRPVKPGRPPHEEALEALAQLLHLFDPQHSREYGIESTRIVRRYIEARFGIRAPLQATEEFLVAASQSSALEPRHRELLAEYLGCCDLLKFARNRAHREELEKLHQAAVRFVNESIPASASPDTSVTPVPPNHTKPLAAEPSGRPAA